jgi:hypothetical protein
MTDQPVTKMRYFFGHSVGDNSCLECNIYGCEKKPIKHVGCGGLIHFHLECYEFNNYYSRCDKCDKEWPDWDDAEKGNK